MATERISCRRTAALGDRDRSSREHRHRQPGCSAHHDTIRWCGGSRLDSGDCHDPRDDTPASVWASQAITKTRTPCSALIHSICFESRCDSLVPAPPGPHASALHRSHVSNAAGGRQRGHGTSACDRPHRSRLVLSAFAVRGAVTVPMRVRQVRGDAVPVDRGGAILVRGNCDAPTTASLEAERRVQPGAPTVRGAVRTDRRVSWRLPRRRPAGRHLLPGDECRFPMTFVLLLGTSRDDRVRRRVSHDENTREDEDSTAVPPIHEPSSSTPSQQIRAISAETVSSHKCRRTATASFDRHP